MAHSIHKYFHLLLLLMLIALPGSAAELTNGEDSYHIGPGDEILISVFGVDDFNREAVVSNSGKVHVPRLGIVTAAGESTSSLATKLEEALKEKGLLADPTVRVEVVDYRSQPVYVMGEVMSPGQYIVTHKMRLSDLIGIANGLADSAGPVAYLYRRRSTTERAVALADGTPESFVDEVKVIDLESLYSDPAVNVQIQGGDMFYIPVPKIEYFFVIGDVHRPGQLEMPTDDGEVYGVRAIAMAGGPLKTAKLTKSVLVSRHADGSVSYQNVDLREIFEGRQADFTIQAGQILFVPGSASKNLGYGLLNALPGIRVF